MAARIEITNVLRYCAACIIRINHHKVSLDGGRTSVVGHVYIFLIGLRVPSEGGLASLRIDLVTIKVS